MKSVTSKDGTTITFDQAGEGPAVILVCGGSVDRSSNAGLAAALPEHFTVLNSPWWPAQEALAHTLAYDATIMGDYSLPTERAAAVTTPTLVIAGGDSWDWMRASAQALADALPAGQYRVLEGQTHQVAAEAL